MFKKPLLSLTSRAYTSKMIPARLTDKDTVLFICDIQETFRGKVVNTEKLICTTEFLLRSAKSLDIPVLVTEQVPFKPTVSELTSLLPESTPVLKKTKFSMLSDETREYLKAKGAKNIIIAGLEAHVCVQQTVLDLLRDSYSVHLAIDAISAQSADDIETMKNRLSKHDDVNISSSLSILYELMGDAKHSKFKEVLGHVKQHIEDSAKVSKL